MTTPIAAAALIAVLVQTIRAFRAQPGDEGGREVVRIWRSSQWAKQFFVDFYGLVIVLALWMTSHAAANDTWWIALPCLLTMPVLGAMPAALYWILCVA